MVNGDYGERKFSSPVVSKGFVVVIDNTVHVSGEELLLLLGVDDETVQWEFFIAMDTSDILAVLVCHGACPTCDCPGLEKTELLSTVRTFESVSGGQQLGCDSRSCHLRCKCHLVFLLMTGYYLTSINIVALTKTINSSGVERSPFIISYTFRNHGIT